MIRMIYKARLMFENVNAGINGRSQSLGAWDINVWTEY